MATPDIKEKLSALGSAYRVREYGAGPGALLVGTRELRQGNRSGAFMRLALRSTEGRPSPGRVWSARLSLFVSLAVRP